MFRRTIFALVLVLVFSNHQLAASKTRKLQNSQTSEDELTESSSKVGGKRTLQEHSTKTQVNWDTKKQPQRPSSEADFSCLKPQYQVPSIQRVCNPYEWNPSGPWYTCASIYKQNHHQVQHVNELVNRFGGAIPASELVEGKHYEESDLLETDLASVTITKSPSANPYFHILVKEIPCKAHGCCTLPYQVRINSTDVISASNFFRCSEYKSLLDLQGIKPKYILDAGGVGMSAVWLALLFPEAIIIRLEPHPDNFIAGAINSWRLPNIKQVNLGLWTKATSLQMCDNVDVKWSPDWPFESSQQQGWYVREPGEPTCKKLAVEDVRVAQLQEIMDVYSVPKFDLMKVDIEGAEFKVFRGPEIMKILSETQVFIAELHSFIVPGANEQVHKIFKEVGGFHYFADDENDIWVKKDMFREGCQVNTAQGLETE